MVYSVFNCREAFMGDVKESYMDLGPSPTAVRN